jgi:hypothetical protein
MNGLLKSTVLGVGLVAGMALAAQAQSVSSLPPGGGVPESAVAPPSSSTQSYYPKPGGNAVWKDDPYQAPADYAANPADHPYSTAVGPKPGSHSSGTDVPYQASSWNDRRVAHPYTAPETGPRPN